MTWEEFKKEVDRIPAEENTTREIEFAYIDVVIPGHITVLYSDGDSHISIESY